MTQTFRQLIIWIINAACVLFPAAITAENTIETEPLSYDDTGQRLLFRTTGISNSDNCTSVKFNIECQDLPFCVDSLQIVVCDTVYSPLSKFVLAGSGKNVKHRRLLWRVKADFPQLYEFSEEDVLRLFTTEGSFDIPLHPMANAASDISMMQDELSSAKTSRSRNRTIILAAVIAALVCIIVSVIYVKRSISICNRRILAERDRLDAEKMEVMRERNAEADERKNLMRSGFNVFNSLCNEYFEKSESELAKATLVKDVENIITAYRQDKTTNELRHLVNANMDDIITKIKTEIPSISESDLQFLTYLYAGFSPRAVCLMTDSKLKNFYNRRIRLRDRILAGDAPHRDWFAAEM